MTELGALDMHGDSALSAKLGHERFILVGFRTAKPVIHVRRVQGEPWNPTAVGEVLEHCQQGNRVRASGEGDEHARTCRDEPLAPYFKSDPLK
jgi:hypothetical protein